MPNQSALAHQNALGASCCAPKTKIRAKELGEFAPLFKVLGDETRLHIIGMLAAVKGELCVCEIEAQIRHLSQPTISHHLRLLKQEGLVTAERRGTWVYYTLNRSFIERLRKAIARIE